MQNILIIGATSAIAEASARLYAARGDHLYLLARDPARLTAIQQDLRIRGAPYVEAATLDVNDIGRHAAVLDAAWANLQNVDTILVAHGTLPDQKACQESVAVTLTEFATNGSSTLALLTLIADRLEKQGRGVLAVISSVAGDRGRASNYVYGAAKAAVSAYASGLRQRFHGSSVTVLTIKPGFVDTPMTREFKKGFLWAKPEQVAAAIVKAVDQRRDVIYVPWFWRPIMMIICHIPETLFKRVRI